MAQLTARDQWSRYLVDQALKQDLKKIGDAGPHSGFPGIPGLDSGLGEHGALPDPREHAPVLEPRYSDGSAVENKVCIVGAGAAGLFTAMLFDYLNNESPPEFQIQYDIFEAGSSVGGRLYTYKFSDKPHDYYDVGAMRFPENHVMTRTFRLFEYLDMKKVREHSPDIPLGSLIPYYMGGVNEPWYFNDLSKTGVYTDFATISQNNDPFVMSFDTENPIATDVLQRAAKEGTDAPIGYAIQPYIDALTADPKEGWKILMSIDKLSTTEFLAMGSPAPDGQERTPRYNYNTIEFLETFNGGTSWYDQAHSETVLEYMDFKVKKPDDWWCIEGGANQLALQMRAKLRNQNINYNTRVTGIDIGTAKSDPVKIQLDGKWGDRKYAGVFNATTMGAMQQMDLVNAGLNYGQKQAIRSLGYGPSSKVGIKFSKPWWINTFGIKKGGLGHSDLRTRTTVYPSYNLYDPADGSAVLLATYQWQQDAQRISTLISSSTDHATALKEELPLKELLLRDLASLHSNQVSRDGKNMSAQEVYDMIKPLYVDHYAHDWYHDPNTFGAFAFFRPQQFGAMWPYIIRSSGNLVIIGEHASNRHAWVVGALESAINGVYNWLSTNPFKGALDLAARMKSWKEPTAENPFGGLPSFVSDKQRTWQMILSDYHEEAFYHHRLSLKKAHKSS